MLQSRLLLVILVSFLSLACALTDAEERVSNRELLRQMAESARAGDIERLQQIAARRSNERAVRLALTLFLYIASPTTYEAEFVTRFPEDQEGIMRDLYEEIELQTLTPEFLFSIKALGHIATRGNPQAIAKVIAVVTQADGVVATQACEAFAELLRQRPTVTLEKLVGLGKEARQKTYLCLVDIDAEQRRAIDAALRSQMDALRTVVDEIRQQLASGD